MAYDREQRGSALRTRLLQKCRGTACGRRDANHLHKHLRQNPCVQAVGHRYVRMVCEESYVCVQVDLAVNLQSDRKRLLLCNEAAGQAPAILCVCQCSRRLVRH